MTQVAITGNDLTARRAVTVYIGRSACLAMSLQDAANHYRRYIEEDNLGASEAKLCTVKENGKKVATVLYNGRVWAA